MRSGCAEQLPPGTSCLRRGLFVFDARRAGHSAAACRKGCKSVGIHGPVPGMPTPLWQKGAFACAKCVKKRLFAPGCRPVPGSAIKAVSVSYPNCEKCVKPGETAANLREKRLRSKKMSGIIQDGYLSREALQKTGGAHWEESAAKKSPQQKRKEQPRENDRAAQPKAPRRMLENRRGPV